jgi:hypothetical protein
LGIISPALAQSAETPPQASEESTITVTGQKKEKSEIRREARSFAGTLIAPVVGQYSRRHTALCPQVLGIHPSYHGLIYKKIRDVATRVGAPVAGNNCRTNMFILFSDNSKESIAKLRREMPTLFSEVPFHERVNFFKQSIPARWWYRTELRDPDGRLLPAVLGTAGNFPPVVGSSYSAQSLIYSTIQVNLMSSVVMIDLNLATGYSLETIAAHAAMVSLVQVKNGKAFEAAPSILNIFVPGKQVSDAPSDLTRWDYAFAQSLYEITPRNSGAAQQSQLAQKMAAKLSE